VWADKTINTINNNNNNNKNNNVCGKHDAYSIHWGVGPGRKKYPVMMIGSDQIPLWGEKKKGSLSSKTSIQYTRVARRYTIHV